MHVPTLAINVTSPTAIDYCLAHEDIFSKLPIFKVADFTPYSKLCRIYTLLYTGNWKPVNENKSVSLNPLPSKFVWDKLQDHVFVETLCNMRGEIDEFLVSERGNVVRM